ncbi:unnamed protein product [Adineta ricciae]|uniref:G-protein coupled receptors family 1 profile domain-containing protein n=1 Tax=Adineta ricciae TaxID=249248 RepID=A0A815HHS8_ADIRI|nr:unnamed protein product [Adineta ricciae]
MNITGNLNYTLFLDAATPYQSAVSAFDLRFFLVRIFYPCLLVWGTIGNALCLRVLLSKKFNKNSTCQYLAILAVIDILFIVMRSSRYIYSLFRDSHIFNTSKWICRCLTFFSSALAHMGSWMLVIVSFDRYFMVTSRYRRHNSVANRVFCSTSILIVVVTLCNLYYFFILGRSMTLGGLGMADPRRFFLRFRPLSNDTSLLDLNYTTSYFQSELFRHRTSSIFICIPSVGYENFFRTYIPIFDILLVAVVPFLVLCFTNVGIISFTMRSHRRVRQHRKRSHRRHQRLTIMLLSVTLAFIGLTCPSVIFICVNKILYAPRVSAQQKESSNENDNHGVPSNIRLIIDVCEALWYTKHAMNFILYTLSGQDFRREFLKLFTHCFNYRFVFLRKTFLNNPQTVDLTNETTIDTQRHNQKKSQYRKKFKAYPNSDTTDLSNSLVTHSNSMEFKYISHEHL